MRLQNIAKILSNKELVINEVVLSQAQKNNQVIYGAKGFNKQVPTHLQKKTYDYDILTKSPHKSAKEVVEILRRRIEGNIEIKKATHKGTYKVLINGVPTIDYTQMKHKPKTKKVWGNEVRDLKSIKRNAVRLSNKKGLEYRREKDLDTLSRIKEIERIESYF